MPRTKLPLSEVFESIGIDTCVLLMKENAHLEPLARRFDDEFHRLPKRRRNPVGAAEVVVEYGLDVNLVRNLLVRLYSRHMQSLAKVKQATRIGEVTDSSLKVAIGAGPDTFDERRVHLEKQGVIDSPKTGGVNVEFNQNTLQQNFGLPSFENTITDLEEKMRQLNPASTEFIEGELVREEERVSV